MKLLDHTIAALGAPVYLHVAGEESAPGVVIARWRHSGADIDVGSPDTVRVAMSLQSGQRVRQNMGSDVARANVTVGSVSVAPTCERTKMSVRGEADVLQIFLCQASLDAAVDGIFACRRVFDSHDSELQAAVMQIFVAARRGDPDDRLLLQLGIQRIAARLRDHRQHQAEEPARGGLARAARARVDDLIVSSLGDTAAPPPTLEQLASAACLSVNHFIRVFRQQTGVTPHRHIVLRRLERGVGLLKKPGMSVAAVADSTGFATPAHFVATFRRMMGVTPGAFQAAVLG